MIRRAIKHIIIIGQRGYRWYEENLPKILFIVFLFVSSYYLVKLPYVNIFTSLFLFLPYLIAWLGILALFKPRKQSILKVGIFLFVANFICIIFGLRDFSETLGDISYFMIATYILMSLGEVRR